MRGVPLLIFFKDYGSVGSSKSGAFVPRADAIMSMKAFLEEPTIVFGRPSLNYSLNAQTIIPPNYSSLPECRDNHSPLEGHSPSIFRE